MYHLINYILNDFNLILLFFDSFNLVILHLFLIVLIHRNFIEVLLNLLLKNLYIRRIRFCDSKDFH